MQPKYMRNLLRLPVPSQRTLERVFQLPRRGSLFFRLIDAKVDHARATLALLTSGDRLGAELLLGHQITVCPPCLSQRFIQAYRPRTVDEDKIIETLGPNPHPFIHASAERAETAHGRFAKLRLGMSIDQALRRGISRRNLREWVASGALTIGRKARAENKEARG